MENLWEYIKTINYFPKNIIKNGQSPRLNLLLHGPPGTGKSSFAYRIAMATKRNIIHVRLSKYNKDEMYDTFIRPKIKGNYCSPKEVVFVLDEFDDDIEKINMRAKLQLKQIDDVK
jgi:replication-associated recombination protein RarA